MESVQYTFQPADTKNATNETPVCYCEFFQHQAKTIISDCHWIEYLTDRIRYFNDAKFINDIYAIQSYIRYEYRTDNGRWRTIFECETMFVKQLNTLMKLTYYGHFNENNLFVIESKKVVNGSPKKTLVQVMRHYRLLPKQHLSG